LKANGASCLCCYTILRELLSVTKVNFTELNTRRCRTVGSN
jgi:hypothetical protein